jgi:hypothetical protein
LENQERTAALSSRWFVSPVFDLLFVANLGWILVALLGPLIDDNSAAGPFWQVYFLTTPHRWLTLVLVLFDPDRREGSQYLIWGLPVFFLAGIVALQWQFDLLVCLAVIDYVWNGWHFGAQHAGIASIYGRKAGGGFPALERHGLRFFVFFVILRTAGWSTGWLEGYSLGSTGLAVADAVIATVGAVVLFVELAQPWTGRLAKRCYLASVIGMYGAMLAALHWNWRAGIIGLTVAGAVFHAVEYLAIVTHYAWRRREIGSDGVFRAMAKHWTLLLLTYMLVIGLGDWLLHQASRSWWASINLWAAFLHYSYDGLIWKLRRPDTARALGAEAAP